MAATGGFAGAADEASRARKAFIAGATAATASVNAEMASYS